MCIDFYNPKVVNFQSTYHSSASPEYPRLSFSLPEIDVCFSLKSFITQKKKSFVFDNYGLTGITLGLKDKIILWLHNK